MQYFNEMVINRSIVSSISLHYDDNLGFQINCIIGKSVLVLTKAFIKGDQPFTVAASVSILLQPGRKSFESSQIWRSRSEDLLSEWAFVTQNNNTPWHP